ncbi:hypothetical protein P3U41_05940 [Mammaliicoccus sciuri]|uniref:hypothetical protein n=1 Tax=Mammaliicoccus sciuri TaxID=1296 RepID=UPI002B25A9DA|nr:hypothetical protein [Mammaliicoccus sciuri]WQL34311.1 hypothetical protein P3U41_05940 [Mammaliicoccus sciuri]WQL61250.1 hypothetical protein P3T96_05940 [Mammaliicoccus sciuri]
MEKFKGKHLYKNRVREQTVKNLILKVEKLHNKHSKYRPIGHKYYYSDTKEFTLSKPEQKLFTEIMKALGFIVKHKRFEKTIYVYKNSVVDDYSNMYLEVMEKLEG